MHDPMFIIKPRLKKPDQEITEAKGGVLPSHSLTVTLLAGECDHSTFLPPWDRYFRP